MARNQKNVSMDEEYQEKLENLAQSLYGSKKKQGQVVEHLLDLHEDESIKGMVEDIHAAVVAGQSSHTQASGAESESDDESKKADDGVLAELERKAAEGESIDPDEYDLSVVKGGEGIARPAIVAQAVLTTHTDLDKTSIQEFCQRQVGYSVNAARNLAQEVLWELEDELYDPIPGKDWLKEQIEEDLRNDHHNARKGGEGMSEAKYRREYAKSIEAYAGARVDLPGDGPHADVQAAADTVYEAFNILLKEVTSSGAHKSRRARAVMKEVWGRTPSEVRSISPSDKDVDLRMLVAGNDDLKEAVMGGD